MSGVTLVLAGLVAAISAGIARLFINPRSNKRVFGGAWIACFAVLFFVSWLYVPPWWAKRNVDRQLRQLHAYQLLEQHDPEAFAELTATIKRSTERLRNATEVMAVSRGLFMKVLRTRIATASDQAALEYFRVNVSLLQELDERGDEACHRYLLASRGEVLDAQDYLTEEMLKAFSDAFVDVLQTSKHAPQKVPPHVDVIPQLTPIFDEMKVEYEQDMSLMANPGAATGAERRRICQIAIGINARFLALPPQQASKVLRYLAASGK